MFGLIGKITAQPGARARLLSLLQQGSAGMPGCLSYVIAKDASHDDVIWVSEAWVSEADHRASLTIPEVRRTIAEARPLIASFETVARIEPVGGHGLVAAPSSTGGVGQGR
jgi:quinol monooxygenase YgiN